MRASAVQLLAISAVVACSKADDPLPPEYPPPSGAPQSELGRSDAQGDQGSPRSPVGDRRTEPAVGRKIATGSISLEGATGDGALVFLQDSDLMVWPAGAAAPLPLVRDYRVGEDSLLIRGRLVAAWLGEDVRPSSPTLWANTRGVRTIAAKVPRGSIYPSPSSDELAYLTPSTSVLRRDVWATNADGGPGARVVSGLDTGLVDKQCRPTITYVTSGLVIAGCPDGSTTPKVTVYALDGSNAARTILEGSAPGVFVNHARTRAVVQTPTTSFIRPLHDLSAPTPLDGTVARAWFSSDDSKLVYLDGDGRVKSASTSYPASPVELLGAAVEILSVSPDARFVLVATKADLSRGRSDIVAIDASARGPTSSRELIAHGGTLIGTSNSGEVAVVLGDPGDGFDRPLSVVPLPSGASHRLASGAQRVVVGHDVVYWQEFVASERSNVLKAARLARPGDVIELDRGLDALTAQPMIVGDRLLVGSKMGLWEYPVLAP